MRPATLGLTLCLLPLALPAAEDRTPAEGQRVLSGTYTSAFNDRPNRLRATFLATEEPGIWKVRFDFSFNNSRRAWHGTAEGSFETGRIAGAVENEDGTRAFTFRLERDEKRFKGIHSEVVGGGRQEKTGTLSLKGRGF